MRPIYWTIFLLNFDQLSEFEKKQKKLQKIKSHGLVRDHQMNITPLKLTTTHTFTVQDCVTSMYQ